MEDNLRSDDSEDLSLNSGCLVNEPSHPKETLDTVPNALVLGGLATIPVGVISIANEAARYLVPQMRPYHLVFRDDLSILLILSYGIGLLAGLRGRSYKGPLLLPVTAFLLTAYVTAPFRGLWWTLATIAAVIVTVAAAAWISAIRDIARE